MLAPLPRPPQDISLEEFDDEDLSEITDDCGIGLNYDSDHYEKVQGLEGHWEGTGGAAAWQSLSWSLRCMFLVSGYQWDVPQSAEPKDLSVAGHPRTSHHTWASCMRWSQGT